MPTPVLHHSFVRADSGKPAEYAILVLHGILGSGSNLRGVAQALVNAQPSASAVLVDLRKHGRSQAFAAPHTVAACAADLCALEAALPLPVRGVVGHSFGGKVSLAYHRLRPALAQLALLDSAPGARPDRHGSEETLRVVEMLERMPPLFARREEFVDAVVAEGHSRMIGEWLAMNLERTPEGFRLRLDLSAIRALLDDYFVEDLWPVLEGSQARIDVVIGGRSRVWDEADRARLQALANERAGRLQAHLLPNAGHWVHVDDPQGLARILAHSGRTP